MAAQPEAMVVLAALMVAIIAAALVTVSGRAVMVAMEAAGPVVPRQEGSEAMAVMVQNGMPVTDQAVVAGLAVVVPSEELAVMADHTGLALVVPVEPELLMELMERLVVV